MAGFQLLHLVLNMFMTLMCKSVVLPYFWRYFHVISVNELSLPERRHGINKQTHRIIPFLMTN